MIPTPDPDILYLVNFHIEMTAGGAPIGGATAIATSPNGGWASTSNPCGDVINPGTGLAGVLLSAGDYDLLISAPGYVDRRLPVHIATEGPPIRIGLDLAPTTWTNAKLRAIRGSIWPTRGPVALGPRPSQDPALNIPSGSLNSDNIIDTGCEVYSPTDTVTMDKALRARRLTHVQVGPFVDPGYHGKYPPVDFRTNPDEVLTFVERWWAQGFAVMSFIGPDNWSTNQMRELEPIFSQPRWQAAMQLIVPYGWEPSKDTSNAQFVERFQWARSVFPHALIYLHLAADFDAPGNNDDFTQGQPLYIGYAQAWKNVVPYLTGFLIQNGPYGTAPDQDPTLKKNFGDQFRADVSGSLRDRFVNGYAGWPTTSANPNGEHLDLIAAEQTSYYAFWNNLPESVSIAWGTVALQNGADGFFDSGS